MPRFRVTTVVDGYWDAIIEADDEQEARDRAQTDFDHAFDSLRPDIEVVPVPDDTKLGDLGNEVVP